jgi:hypothetical protein
MHIPGLPSSLHYGNLVNRACPLNRGLVSWWLSLPLGGKGAAWFDIASKNHGTLTNGPTWSGALGRQGGCGALSLDGSDDNVAVSALVLTEDFTVCQWLYPLTIGGFQTAFTRGGTSWSMFMHGAAGGDIYWRLVGAESFVTLSPDITTNEWQFVTWTRTGSDNVIYRNAVPAGSFSSAASIGSGGMNFGVAGNGGAAWHGLQDDMRFFNGGKSAAEIAAIYNDSRQGYPQTLNRIRPVRLGTAAVGGTAARARFYALLNVA